MQGVLWAFIPQLLQLQLLRYVRVAPREPMVLALVYLQQADARCVPLVCTPPLQVLPLWPPVCNVLLGRMALALVYLQQVGAHCVDQALTPLLQVLWASVQAVPLALTLLARVLPLWPPVSTVLLVRTLAYLQQSTAHCVA